MSDTNRAKLNTFLLSVISILVTLLTTGNGYLIVRTDTRLEKMETEQKTMRDSQYDDRSIIINLVKECEMNREWKRSVDQQLLDLWKERRRGGTAPDLSSWTGEDECDSALVNDTGIP